MFIANIVKLEHHKVSQLGNPQYKVYFRNGDKSYFLTKPNGGVNLDITGPDYRNYPVLVETNSYNHIVNLTAITSEDKLIDALSNNDATDDEIQKCLFMYDVSYDNLF